MQASGEPASQGTLQDHSQWFSPLGSSASRIMLTVSPSFPSSSAPASLSALPVLDSALHVQGAASNSQAGYRDHQTQSAGGPAAYAGQPHQRPFSSTHAHIATASTPAMTFLQREISSAVPEANAFTSWVAFTDAAQPDPPEAAQACHQHQPAHSVPLQNSEPSAPRYFYGTAKIQPGPLMPCVPFSQSSSSVALADAPPMPHRSSNAPIGPTQPEPQGMKSASGSSKQSSMARVRDLLQWEGADQKQGEQWLVSSTSDGAARALGKGTQEPSADRAPEHMHSKLAADSHKENGDSSTSPRGVQPVSKHGHAAAASHARTDAISHASSTDVELQVLKTQVRQHS